MAFIYQNRLKPSVLNIYKAAVLRRAVKNSQATMAQAYSQLLENKPDDVSLFDYSSDVWASNQAASDKEIEQLIESMNMDAVTNLSKNKQQQLYELTEWAHDAGLDIYPVNIDNQFCIGRKGLDSVKSDAAFKLVTIQKSKIKLSDTNYSLENLATYEEDKDKFAEQYSVDREGYWPVDYTQQNSTDEDMENNDEDSDMTIPSLNQILYGPPGTGKTYHTIEAAVKAAEPEYYLDLNIKPQTGATKEQRAALQSKYQELCDAKRIRFVTFHQSYGYEEFVEGLSASSTDGQVSYDVKAGVFKSICEQATQGVEQDNDPLEIAIANLKEELEEGTSLSLSTQRGKAFDIQYHGNTTFRAFPHETSHEDLGNGYPVAIDSIRKLYRGANVREFYNPSYVKAILKHLVTKYKLPEKPVISAQNAKNFVLVIDEINRGNISKIFGELITLIEDSKRSGKGQTESIEVVLPHSGDTFSVPDNLYLIGTMNTADRSLAMMDTALRRRFEFIEMMPKPSLLSGVVVRGIDLERLLETLNQRIEVLYDREHTLGHAFFMPVKECVEQGDDTQAFTVLKSVFQNKIIPLLEEYFFEDWHKIRLVLADNQKAENSQAEGLQFIAEQKLTNTALDSLFGHNHGLNQYGEEQHKFTLKDKTDSVWDNPAAYLGIYSLRQALGD